MKLSYMKTLLGTFPLSFRICAGVKVDFAARCKAGYRNGEESERYQGGMAGMSRDLEGRGGRVTLHDVAAAAGVSKSTVSRILDERLPQSDNDTARRVRQVAADLGYIRDISASSLRRGKTMAIGVIVPRLTDTVMAMLYEAIAKACAKNGRIALVATTDDNIDADERAAETLIQRGVDGLILATARTGDDLPDKLERRGVPHVLALRTDGHSPSAIGDDRLGGYLATRHLIDLGHQRIAIIAGPSFASSSRERLAGYKQALEEASIALDPSLIMESSFSIEAGAEAAEAIMALDQRPTAIFAVNDNTAIGALSKLTNMGITVPGDISLVGYNDIPIVSHLPTPLTTMRVPFDQIAAAALELLDTPLAAGNSATMLVAPTLIPRRSSGRVAE
ncbi:LacI family transcriptional regulator [Sphingobium yanoikuyae]|jgi:LacI family transcriptional regulator|uniref:LacI family transcriptional regulator n=3 Tax=Sphingobium yanoikuyae TaxID=13690 RepID=A0AA42X0H7_SPHYA|nr:MULTISPECIES: LacI family DNA-binding transcriptional regulator [Sphingobium]MDH2135230.1 LacI family transcriptional regulator [Sphingobium yanoikuyae]MDH2150127.1 LacI family transcriptional regulator [Sphingobium yanoikuyae]MDH2170564.1 LacI family transcriptional regulator [Sphingobium yanoikuyae]